MQKLVYTPITPEGITSDEWQTLLDKNQNFGYNELLRTGIKSGFSTLSLVRTVEEVERFVKDDAPLTSTTTAAWNPVFGRDVWVWQNVACPVIGALAKQAWTRSGIRVKTANSSTLVSGLGETSALPESTLPTYAYMKFPLKQMVTRIDYTAKMIRLAASGDDAIATPEQIRKDKTDEHILGLNRAILANAETQAAGAAGNYSGTNVYEALDRLISCKIEEDDLGGTYSGWYDPYDGTSYDRDTGQVYDAVVVHGDGTVAEGTNNPDFAVDAYLTLRSKDVLLEKCLSNGLKIENAMWVTGQDTYFRLKQLYEVKERYMEPKQYTFDVNGVQTPTGSKVGMKISTMDDIPIIIDQNAPKDTISKLFLIDRSNVFLRTATPTTMIDLGFPAFSVIGSALAQRLAYGQILLTEGELVVTRFNTSGKLCALK
ncbi:MAG: hypothetical protein NWE98_02055 [Candidatus Bathyarchaeota archaeon]|nr:hypothetical protein [Candidatus Bathyarchaeota archaeon]